MLFFINMPESPKNPEVIPENHGRILKKGQHFFATVDGKHSVPVQAPLAKNIDTALRAREKIDAALTMTPRPPFLRLVAMLNCRKTVEAVTGSPLRPLLRSKDLSDPNLSNRDRARAKAEMDGVPEMMADVKRFLDSGSLPVLGTEQDMQVADHLDHHRDELPAVVHIFFVPRKNSTEIISKLMGGGGGLSVNDVVKLPRSHTFIVLEKADNGEYICFQKLGPELEDPFELQYLNAVLQDSAEGNAGRMCLSFVGPLAMKKRAKATPKKPA